MISTTDSVRAQFSLRIETHQNSLTNFSIKGNELHADMHEHDKLQQILIPDQPKQHKECRTTNQTHNLTMKSPINTCFHVHFPLWAQQSQPTWWLLCSHCFSHRNSICELSTIIVTHFHSTFVKFDKSLEEWKIRIKSEHGASFQAVNRRTDFHPKV